MSANVDGEGGSFDWARHACWNEPCRGDLAGLFGPPSAPFAAAISRCRFGNFPVTAEADLGGKVNFGGPRVLDSTWIDRFGMFLLIPVRGEGIDCLCDNEDPCAWGD
jgi:hypothetical protein